MAGSGRLAFRITTRTNSRRSAALKLVTTFVCAWLVATVPTVAKDYVVGTIRIINPWSRATPPNAKVAVGYLSVVNEGAQPDRLIGGSSEIAGRVEIHETSTTDGVARMRPVTSGVLIGSREKAELKPGGTHLMFVKPIRSIKQGETFNVTLRLEKAGPIDVEFSVEGVGAIVPSTNVHQQHGRAQ